jgi:hypothetical protein
MRSRSVLFAAVAAFAPLALQAANPHIIINSDPPNPIIITTPTFTFGANQSGGGDLSFKNESGVTFESLEFMVTLPGLDTITTGPGPFITSTIAVTPVSNGFLYDILFGPAAGAVPNGTGFSINLNNSGNDPNGNGDWGSGTDFSGAVNTAPLAPEPSTFALAGGGILIAGFFYRRQRRAATTV